MPMPVSQTAMRTTAWVSGVGCRVSDVGRWTRWLVAAPLDRDLAAFRRVLDRVVDQVVENLAQTFAIGLHSARRFSRARLTG